MEIVAYLAGLGLLTAGLLAVPLDLRFRISRNGDLHSQLRLEWMFGVVGRDIEHQRGERAARHPAGWLRLLRDPALREALAALGRRVRRAIEVRRLTARARFGLGDPADTGIALGLISPLLAAAESLENVELALEPDFEDAILAGELRGDLRTWPIALVPPLFRFVAAPATLRAVRTLWEKRP